jgi:hypothetical protein
MTKSKLWIKKYWILIAIILLFIIILLIKYQSLQTVLYILILFNTFILSIISLVFSEETDKDFIIRSTIILGVISILFTLISYFVEEKKMKQKEDLIRLREIVKEDLIPKFDQIHLSIHMRHHILDETKDTIQAKLKFAEIINHSTMFKEETIKHFKKVLAETNITIKEKPEIDSLVSTYFATLDKVMPDACTCFKNMVLVNEQDDNSYGESKAFLQLDSLDSK